MKMKVRGVDDKEVERKGKRKRGWIVGKGNVVEEEGARRARNVEFLPSVAERLFEGLNLRTLEGGVNEDWRE